MTRVIAIANQKGGVGKTTTACTLSACFAAAERQTLLIDLDPQSNATHTMGLDPRDVTDRNISHVLNEPERIKDVIENVDDNLDVLPSSITLAKTERFLMSEANSEYRLSAAIDIVSDKYDYVIIDCPPSLHVATLNAFQAAPEIIIPFSPDIYSFLGLEDLIDIITSIQKYQKKKIITYGLLCRYDSRQIVDNDAMDRLQEIFGNRVLPPIRKNAAVVDATSQRSTIIYHKPNSIGSKDFIHLAKTIMRMEQTDIGTVPTLTVIESEHGGRRKISAGSVKKRLKIFSLMRLSQNPNVRTGLPT